MGVQKVSSNKTSKKASKPAVKAAASSKKASAAPSKPHAPGKGQRASKTPGKGPTSKQLAALSKSPLLSKGLLDAATGETVCREIACEGLATSGGYCRLHYIKNWKKIKRKEV